MIRRFILMLLLGASTIALFGCISTSTGSEFKSENVEKMEIGKTTEQEVIQLIGQPETRSVSGDGSVILFYMYNPGQNVHAFSMLNPNFMKDAGKGRDTLMIQIGPDGTVTNYSFSDS